MASTTTLHHAAPTETGLAAAAPLVGRLFISAIFLLSGINKITNPAGMIGYIEFAGLPLAPVGLGIAIAIELLGGLALVLGYRTRLTAGLIAVFTLATAILFHHTLADQNQFIHFFKNVAITGGLLQIVAYGGGRFSLDARRGA